LQSEGDYSKYEDFPIIGYVSRNSNFLSSYSNTSNDEILFSGQQENCCICFIDIIDSTRISSQLAGRETSIFYGTFLNSVATIARNFGAKILKNAGDCLIYYFSNTSGSSKNSPVFKNVLECGITIISAHRIINSKLLKHNLPPLNYRISADYGKVEFAKSVSSQAVDLFGPAVNLCAKINSKAPRNGMVIGNNLYEIVKSIDDFTFEGVKGVSAAYDVYAVKDKRKRIILNPFKQYSQNELQ
jgi:class 3 adenylate cyclase